MLCGYVVITLMQVPTGVLDKDETRVSDMIDILTHYQEHYSMALETKATTLFKQ